MQTFVHHCTDTNSFSTEYYHYDIRPHTLRCLLYNLQTNCRIKWIWLNNFIVNWLKWRCLYLLLLFCCCLLYMSVCICIILLPIYLVSCRAYISALITNTRKNAKKYKTYNLTFITKYSQWLSMFYCDFIPNKLFSFVY